MPTVAQVSLVIGGLVAAFAVSTFVASSAHTDSLSDAVKPRPTTLGSEIVRGSTAVSGCYRRDYEWIGTYVGCVGSVVDRELYRRTMTDAFEIGVYVEMNAEFDRQLERNNHPGMSFADADSNSTRQYRTAVLRKLVDLLGRAKLTPEDVVGAVRKNR